MFLTRVLFLPEAAKERSELVPRERAALDTAVLKLEALADQLPFPHQSAIKGAANLRELRPRGGRSAWRAFYRQQDKDTFVVAAVGSEAVHDPKGFKGAVRSAEERLKALEVRKPS